MNSAKETFSLVSGIIVLAFCLSACKYVLPRSSIHKSDRVLIADFQKNKSKFEQLIQMAERDVYLDRVFADGNYFVAPHYPGRSSPKRSDEIKAEIESRLPEYKKLLAELGLMSLSHIGRDAKDFSVKSIIFMISEENPTSPLYVQRYVISSSKSYYFTKNEAVESSKLVDELDKYHLSNEKVYSYRQIEPNWYLHLNLSAHIPQEKVD